MVVLEAYARDVGRGIARFERRAMEGLGLSTGDLVEIRGKRTTAAKCLPVLTPEELRTEQEQLDRARQQMRQTRIEDKNTLRTEFKWDGRGVPEHKMKAVPQGWTVRIDGIVRNNAGIAIGDTVAVRKIPTVTAEKVVVSPLADIPPIDERYMADALEAIPVTKGDNVMVPYFGGRLTFNVTDVSPGAVSVVAKNTVFYISGKPNGMTMIPVRGIDCYGHGKRISFVLEHAVRKESRDDAYLVLKIHLFHGGFAKLGQFQARLDGSSIKEMVIAYRKAAEEVVNKANDKLGDATGMDLAGMINDLEFEILEKWRKL